MFGLRIVVSSRTANFGVDQDSKPLYSHLESCIANFGVDQHSKAKDASAAKPDEKETKNKAKKAILHVIRDHTYSSIQCMMVRPLTKPRRRSSLKPSYRRRRPRKRTQTCSSPSCMSCDIRIRMYLAACDTQGRTPAERHEEGCCRPGAQQLDTRFNRSHEFERCQAAKLKEIRGQLQQACDNDEVELLKP